MSLKAKISRKLKESDYGKLIYYKLSGAKAKREFKKYDDYTMIRKKFKDAWGYDMDLINPKTYMEKIQWFKLFYRNDLAKIVSDKVAVKEYLEKEGYGDLLNETLAIYNSVDEIDLKKLPKQFVMKAAHGSGWNLIVHDKDAINWKTWKKIFATWLKQDLGWFGREWNYYDMPRRILVEKYLEDDSGELRDYKIVCINGEAKYMHIDEGRFSTHRRIFVDENGQLMHDGFDYKLYENGKKIPFGENQKKMFEIARKLCKPFPHVRIDFYECNGKIYFGEFTFFSGSGFTYYVSKATDRRWCEEIALPEPNYNLELYKKLKEESEKDSN